MSSTIDVSALNARMKEKAIDFQTIFGQRLANGFHAKGDFVSLGIKDKVTLTRETMSNITQPGKTGELNNKEGNFVEYKQRTGELKPAKVDLYIDELMLEKLSTSFLANRQPADPKDIHSLAGADYIMSRVIAQIGQEVNAAIYRGQLGYGYDDTTDALKKSTRFQGGLNLMDGLGLKFTQGYATSGAGAVGDIPGANKVTGAASSMSEAVVLAELKKMEDVIINSGHLESYAYDDPDAPTASLYINGATKMFLADALDNLTYKATKLVEPDGDGFRFKKLPKVKIKARRWMSGVANMFFSPDDNLFYLHQDVDEDIPAIKFQEVGRGIQILIDFKLGVDYADGRSIVLWK